jgi:chemotaxis protein CheD
MKAQNESAGKRPPHRGRPPTSGVVKTGQAPQGFSDNSRMEILVAPADMKVSANPQHVLATEALGTAVGLAAFDPVRRAGGILHFLLPDASLSRSRAQKTPCLFADTGIPALLQALVGAGGEVSRLQVTVAGGAGGLDQKGPFDIGQRNLLALRRILQANQIPIHHEVVGGQFYRSLRLDLHSGRIRIAIPGHGEMTL